MKLSFIIPIYNVRPYLAKCVESLVAQDFEGYEIILVDDGSTDGSGELADELVLRYGILQKLNIRAIHQKNAGLSAARNAGIPYAQGEYVCFVDSDDYWQPNVLGALMAQVEQDQLDVLRFRWQNVKESGDVFSPYKDVPYYGDFSPAPTDGVTFLNTRMGTQCYAVMFILKKSLLEGCTFTDGILFEDTDWTPRLLMKAERVAGADTIVYNYLWRDNSITLSKSPDKVRQELENKLSLIEKLQTWNELVNGDCDKDGVERIHWFDTMITTTMLSLMSILSTTMYAERRSYLSRLLIIVCRPLSLNNIGPKAQRKVRLFNFSPRLAIFLLHLKNK